jgi:periplasmic divalent cation tolerance protein
MNSAQSSLKALLAMIRTRIRGASISEMRMNAEEIPMGAIIVLTTTDSADLAQRIAVALVDSGNAACVNIVPGVRSIYRWDGNICNEGEHLMIIKTTAENFEQVRSIIRSLHGYQLPEILAIPVSGGDPEYLSWLAGNCAG